jgi:hypothetical protein
MKDGVQAVVTLLKNLKAIPEKGVQLRLEEC